MSKPLKTINKAASLGGKAPKIITRFNKYLVVGTTTTIADYLFFLLLTLLLFVPYLWAAVISYLLFHTIAFYMNKNWEFKDSKTPELRGLFYFTLFGVVGTGMTIIFLDLFVETFKIHYVISRVLVYPISGAINFALNYLITFKIKPKWTKKK